MYYVERVQCPIVPVISNGILYAPTYGAGSIATLRCFFPYIVEGSLIYTCTRGENSIRTGRVDWIGTGRCGMCY